MRLFMIAGLLFVLEPSVSAYLDEVLMTPEEVWTASKIVMETTGIESEDKENYTLKGKWIEDYTRKDRKLLPDALGRGVTLPQTVHRRYKLTVKLEELATGTQVHITGKYQERPTGAPEHQSRWKFVKPSTEDFELERILFFKILREMSRIKISQN